MAICNPCSLDCSKVNSCWCGRSCSDECTWCGGSGSGACRDTCTGDCDGSCDGSCSGGCYGNCSGSCSGGCQNTCQTTCSGECKGTCQTTCSGSCSGGCSTACTGSCANKCNIGCTSTEDALLAQLTLSEKFEANNFNDIITLFKHEILRRNNTSNNLNNVSEGELLNSTFINNVISNLPKINETLNFNINAGELGLRSLGETLITKILNAYSQEIPIN